MIDLSGAYGAAAVAVAADKGRVNTTDRDRVLGECVVDVAVVPVLEAVRDRLDREYNEGYDAVAGMYRNFDESMRLQDVRRWLDGLIEDVKEQA